VPKTPTPPLERYRKAAEALLDTLTLLETRTHNLTEYHRIKEIVATCQEDLDRARQEFDRVPEDLKSAKPLDEAETSDQNSAGIWP
jgi:hypothetical protein